MTRSIPFCVLLSVLAIEACVNPRAGRQEMRKVDPIVIPPLPKEELKVRPEPARIEVFDEERIELVQETIIIVPKQPMKRTKISSISPEQS